MADGVLSRAFGGEIGSGKKGNYKSPSAMSQPMPSLFGDPGEDSNFEDPDEDVQGYADGGEVDEGKVAAADEILSAFASKDPKQLASALQAFVEQCDEQDEPSEMP